MTSEIPENSDECAVIGIGKKTINHVGFDHADSGGLRRRIKHLPQLPRLRASDQCGDPCEVLQRSPKIACNNAEAWAEPALSPDPRKITFKS
ncbi:MAG: hypothetical protein AAGB10_12140 [Pseudomonadota bacterium]